MKIEIDPSVEDFIRSLEKRTIAKVLRTIDLLEKFDYRLGMPHSKKLQSNLYELRVRGKQEVRIFYTFSGQKAVLLHGFVKKKQKTPTRELKTASRRLAEFGDQP